MQTLGNDSKAFKVGKLECFVEKWELKGKISELGRDQLAVEEIEYEVEMEGEVKVE
jgi:hypothetical protein